MIPIRAHGMRRRMNRILLESSELDAEGRAELTGRRARHVRDVLRAGPGDAVRVGILEGPLGRASILEIRPDLVRLQCALERHPPPRPSVDLIMALPRPKALKRLYATVASLGEDRWWLVNADRVERDYFDTHVLHPGFIRDRLIEGLEQCGDTRLPEVSVRRRLKPFIEDELDGLCPDAGIRCLFHPRAERDAQELRGRLAHQSRVLLALGPEGGWVDYELDLLARHGFLAVRLGTGRILRNDTAAIAALAVIDALRTPGPV